jgi:hypothetical protein
MEQFATSFSECRGIACRAEISLKRHISQTPIENYGMHQYCVP